MASMLISLSVLAPLIAAAIVAGRRFPVLLAGRITAIASGVATLAAIALVALSAAETDGRVGDIGLVDISTDRVSSLLLVVVFGTGAVIAGFSRRSLDDDHRVPGYFARLGVVVGGSALVVLPSGPVTLAAGWLAASWALTGLLGWKQDWAPAAVARRRVRLTLWVGDVALITSLGLLAIIGASGVTRGDAAALAELGESSILGVSTVHIFALLVVVAGASRSALFPFHRWLVGTLVAPTPVSALVHAGFVSGAGLLLIRFATPFAASDAAVLLAFALGLVTVLVGAAASSMRSDVKGSLAWSTVAQMSFMVIQCAVGAFSSAVFHIIGHGMYKAAMFLGAGDTVSAGLRSVRRPTATPISPMITRAVVVLVPTALVTLGFWLITPDVGDAGKVLIAVFAWLSTAAALQGWLTRAPFNAGSSIASGIATAALTVAVYFAGLRLLERFVKPTFGAGTEETIIDATVLTITLALVGVTVIGVLFRPGREGVETRARVQSWFDAMANAGVRSSFAPRPTSGAQEIAPRSPSADLAARSAQIRADVARSGRVVAPMWPLTSFVAVNPLGGLESVGFDAAAADARRWLRGKTHLDLADYRSDMERGLVTAADLNEAVHIRFMEQCSRPDVMAGPHSLSADSLLLLDLLHGPAAPDDAALPRTALERRGPLGVAYRAIVDEVLTSWLVSYVSPPTWQPAARSAGFVAMCRQRVATDARLRPLIGAPALRWISELGSDPARIVDDSFAVSAIVDEHRVDEMRGLLACIPGWSGYAKWRNEWAQPDDTRPVITLLEIAAVSAMVEAAVIVSSTAPELPADDLSNDQHLGHLAARVDAVIGALDVDVDRSVRDEITNLLESVPESERLGAWLQAQESNLDRRLLAMLDRAPAHEPQSPESQIVMCIDVRSEGLRRHLETQGVDTTIGFAGFFGVPMRVREVGWDHAEARCPVLVAPALDAVETPDPRAVDRLAAKLRRSRISEGVHHAHVESKHVFGSSFVAAETLGWLLGPIAAIRTLAAPPAKRSERVTTVLRFDDSVLVEQRVFFAESVLNTMGLIDGFAPLVVLTGHTSVTTNNAHATALECGACAGASGDGTARAVAALLNSPDVRAGLRERGIEIPDETWFLAGLHDTISDRIELLDTAHAPASHDAAVQALRGRLAIAARQQAADRSQHLPGPAAKVADRGADWAQVRPEWGLARNAAFIIGPRSLTAGLDLSGRAFLHTYDHRQDPSGKVLQTIMTAPLVVGHWISSQYYFSTVDPEAFGAGDKLIHNPVGSIGVISGDTGDIRVGLPLQSTHISGQRHHQPLRLLAVIQADIASIEAIIQSHPILQTLTGGSWIRIAARADETEPWSMRTPQGTWLSVTDPFIDDTGAAAFAAATLSFSATASAARGGSVLTLETT